MAAMVGAVAVDGFVDNIWDNNKQQPEKGWG